MYLFILHLFWFISFQCYLVTAILFVLEPRDYVYLWTECVLTVGTVGSVPSEQEPWAAIDDVD